MKTKMYISCMLALMITAAAWTQVAPSSPQNDATAGLTFTEGDQFMSVTDWGSVSFNKAFAYIDYTAGMKKADIGAAFKAGPVYIGSYYSGNFGAFGTNANQQEVDTDPTLSTSGSTAGSFTNVKKTTRTQFGTHYDAQHTAAVLVTWVFNSDICVMAKMHPVNIFGIASLISLN